MTPLAAHLKSADFVLLTPSYPKPWRGGGEFVRTRARAYAAAGLRGVVIEPGLREGSAPAPSADGELSVWNVPADAVGAIVQEVAATSAALLAHSPAPGTIDEILTHAPLRRTAVWFHGYEVRDYRRLAGNNTSRELAIIRSSRDQLNRDRFAAAGRLFSEDRVTVVFVSEFQRSVAAKDIGAIPANHQVIPNHIDGDLFRARIRQPEEATRLLLMRSFSQRNYGNDIALRALEILAARPGFSRLQITIRGFGEHFATETDALRGLSNVAVEERYSSPIEMAAAHQRHGVFLCPTRFDTQGVMLGEAMASGMASITHPVAAIPEFTDATCSLLPRAEDPWAFAEAIGYLLDNRDLLPAMSAAAANRVRRQCGHDATIGRELELIGGLTA